MLRLSPFFTMLMSFFSDIIMLGMSRIPSRAVGYETKNICAVLTATGMNMGQQNIWQRFIVKRRGFDIWWSINSLKKRVTVKKNSLKIGYHSPVGYSCSNRNWETIQKIILIDYSTCIKQNYVTEMNKPTFRLGALNKFVKVNEAKGKLFAKMTIRPY